MKIKNIKFNFEIECDGIVNWDCDEQKHLFKQVYQGPADFKNKNFAFGKANYENDINGLLKRYPKISADCIRREIFQRQQHTPTIANSELMLLDTISHPLIYSRGYLFPTKGDNAIKRSSALSITQAQVQAPECVSQLEVHNNDQTSFLSKEGEDKQEKNKTSYYYKESRPNNLIYKGKGSISIEQLSFISFSQYHDRLAIPIDFSDTFIEMFKEKLQKTIQSIKKLKTEEFLLEKGFFFKENDCYKIPEFGCHLSESIIKELVIFNLKNIAQAIITKATAVAKMNKIDIVLLGEDPIEEKEEFVLYQNGKFDSNFFDVLRQSQLHRFYEFDVRTENEIKESLNQLKKIKK